MATLNRQQVREVDRRAMQEYGMSGLVLMENAGRGVAEYVFRLMVGQLRIQGVKQFPAGLVTIVCGKGNNGGDGYVIARHLDLFGVKVRVAVLCNPTELSGDAAANFAIIEKAGLPIEIFTSPLEVIRFATTLAGSASLVDAILGTGAVGEPKSPYAEAIDRMNASGLPIVAVDLPSGLDCDTGAVSQHTIRAAHTCTFVAAKPGFFVAGARPFVGIVHVLDIGVPRKLHEEIEAGEVESEE